VPKHGEIALPEGLDENLMDLEVGTER